MAFQINERAFDRNYDPAKDEELQKRQAQEAADAQARIAAEKAEQDKIQLDYQQNPGTTFNPKWNVNPVPTGKDGRPMLPGFNSIGDDTTGLLKDPYNLKSSLNMDALKEMRGQALAQGPSKWSLLQQQVQGDNIAQQQASQTQQAKNNIASQGGLRSGAGERLASIGQRQGQLLNQNMQSNLANQDEQNKQNLLRALPGMETQAAGYNDDVSKYNIQGAKDEIFQRRAFDTNNYNEAMRGWASEKAARATPSGGKK